MSTLWSSKRARSFRSYLRSVLRSLEISRANKSRGVWSGQVIMHDKANIKLSSNNKNVTAGPVICIIRIAISICAVAQSLIRFSYIVLEASGFLSRGATVSTHWGRRGEGGGRHTCAHVRIFSPSTFSSVYASNPSLLSGWFMERRGLFHPWEIGITAKVLDVGVAKWFDEISIRSREYSPLFLSLKTDGTVVASVGEWNCWEEEEWWYLWEIGEFIFRM